MSANWLLITDFLKVRTFGTLRTEILIPTYDINKSDSFSESPGIR